MSPDPAQPPPKPLAYFITFHTYGTHLHGAEGGSVDRRFNEINTPIIHRAPSLEAFEREHMNEEPLHLTPQQRQLLDATFREVCTHRRWLVHALNVRMTHTHIVVTAPEHNPERIMGDLKAWGTRRLRESDLAAGRTNIWSRHGSTRWLWDRPSFDGAVDYVLNRQSPKRPTKH